MSEMMNWSSGSIIRAAACAGAPAAQCFADDGGRHFQSSLSIVMGRSVTRLPVA
jgi:hypothetical protein